MKILIAVAIAAATLTLGGCNEGSVEEFKTQYVAIVPPDTLYECPRKPARPSAPVTDAKVAEYIVRLDNAHSVCSRSLSAIRAFANQAKLQVQQNSQ